MARRPLVTLLISLDCLRPRDENFETWARRWRNDGSSGRALPWLDDPRSR